jgi:hypothetical protein
MSYPAVPSPNRDRFEKIVKDLGPDQEAGSRTGVD